MREAERTCRPHFGGGGTVGEQKRIPFFSVLTGGSLGTCIDHQAFLREEGGPRQRWKEPAQPKRCILRIAKNIGVFGAEDIAKQSQDCILISSAAISRQYDIFASPIVTTELLPSAFGVHTKNVSSPLRSGEITTAAIPVFGKAETPPALWRRGVQPRSKNGSRFCSCQRLQRFVWTSSYSLRFASATDIFWADQRRPECVLALYSASTER